MIELIFAYFAIQNDLMLLNQDVTGELCRRIHLTGTMVRTDEIYPVAEKRWAEDETTLESFYAFWENRDTCNPDKN